MQINAITTNASVQYRPWPGTLRLLQIGIIVNRLRDVITQFCRRNQKSASVVPPDLWGEYCQALATNGIVHAIVALKVSHKKVVDH